ncbi:MAG: long-chain fatty acid--CoA ligase [Candidatus Promineifilaceae bacterium]|nr:long-chain fatty acid--CoA ligase [Candidatus Promineifilaceae bacterium]
MDAVNLLSRRALLTPEREALYEVATGRRFTYRELSARANRAAHFLRDRCGVQMGDRVSLLAHNGVEYLDLLYGVATIGAVFAPLNWRLAGPELIYIVDDCAPKVLLVGAEFVSLYDHIRPQITVEHTVALTGASLEGAPDYEQALLQMPDEQPERPEGLDGESAQCILYTSGTTGRPKGAIIPQRQVLWNCINTVISWGLTAEDISPIFTPLFHSGGLFAFMVPLLYVGGRIALDQTFDVERSLRVIEDERCTVILGVPTLFQMWRKSHLYQTVDLGHVHFFISGGAPCPPELIDAWREEKKIVFRQGYGLTEVGPNCFSMTDIESAEKVGTVGKPVFHSEVRLVDEAGRDVPVGEVGELLIRGPHVCNGYWRHPQATADALEDGWFHTGDMARVDEDGFYTIVGRFKDMIISGGENIYAAEVEAVVRQHPAVEEAALIGKPHEKWGEVGLMVVVPRNGQTVEKDELTDFCRARLAGYKVPREIVFAAELPFSPYGKVQKKKLRERYVEQTSAATG